MRLLHFITLVSHFSYEMGCLSKCLLYWECMFLFGWGSSSLRYYLSCSVLERRLPFVLFSFWTLFCSPGIILCSTFMSNTKAEGAQNNEVFLFFSVTYLFDCFKFAFQHFSVLSFLSFLFFSFLLNSFISSAFI